jgi:hypothetical protein
MVCKTTSPSNSPWSQPSIPVEELPPLVPLEEPPLVLESTTPEVVSLPPVDEPPVPVDAPVLVPLEEPEELSEPSVSITPELKITSFRPQLTSTNSVAIVIQVT